MFAFVRWPTALNSSVWKSLIAFNGIKFCLILFNFRRCLIIIDFPGSAPNRFIMIYWKRDQDGTKRKFNKSPEISPPRVVHSGSKIGTVWNKTKPGNASEFPIIHIDVERVFLARWALFRPKVTGLWMWTINENNWHYFRVRVHPLGWIISRDWLIL